jgi:hypothetical protein
VTFPGISRAQIRQMTSGFADAASGRTTGMSAGELELPHPLTAFLAELPHPLTPLPGGEGRSAFRNQLSPLLLEEKGSGG